MRILVANDGLSDVGGVQSYLDCVLSGLAARGHAVAIVHCSDSGRPEVRAVNRQFESFTFADGWQRRLDRSARGRPTSASPTT